MDRRAAEAFAREHLAGDVVARDRERVFWREGFERLARAGVFAARPMAEAVDLWEGLGKGCEDGGLLLAAGAHYFACVLPLDRHGTEAQRALLPGLRDGSRIGALGMTEASSGANAFAMAGRGTKDGGWVLDTEKVWITNGPVADVALVFVRTAEGPGIAGITGFVVEGPDRGPALETMGLRTCPLGSLAVRRRVGDEARLGPENGGATLFFDIMDGERIGLSAANVGAMARVIDQSVAYARRRRLAGRQAVAHRLAGMKVRMESARALVRQATSAQDAAVAKLATSEARVANCLDALQIFGAHGYLVETGLERELRDAVGALTYSGPGSVQLGTIAAWMGVG